MSDTCSKRKMQLSAAEHLCILVLGNIIPLVLLGLLKMAMKSVTANGM